MKDNMPTLGSQRLLQLAVNSRPELFRSALRRCGALGRREAVEWKSPLTIDDHCEYRDAAALKQFGIESELRTPLTNFWPARGAVWDGLGLHQTVGRF